MNFVLNLPTIVAIAVVFCTLAPRIGAKERKPMGTGLLVVIILVVVVLLVIGQYSPATSAMSHIIH